MTALEIVFLVLAGLVVYTYAGYGACMILFAAVKDRLTRPHQTTDDKGFEPTVTLIVAAFNEEAWLATKIENSLSLDYPQEKFTIVFVTDGSTDGFSDIIGRYPRIAHLHQNERRGKTAAMNRAMKSVDSQIVVFSDANAMLNREAIRKIVAGFRDARVGCVCGEKRLRKDDQAGAADAGEGFYWRYESRIKAAEARLGSCIGAAGELFAVRGDLFTEIPEDTILDDFTISLGMALRGYRVAYAADAYATETASADMAQEWKRKIRIAAGHVQFLIRMPELLNPFRQGLLAFQYLSHKFLRSFVTPVCFVLLFPLNLLLVTHKWPLYVFMLSLQGLFYLTAGAGYCLQKRRVPVRGFFLPLYVVMMNAAAWIGVFRYLQGRQTVLWDKARRQVEATPQERIPM
ncbi:MAG TPA: glycosyltransferase family 2 protein [Smithellaceae bacterium]|nr:glycosyltransferase family 2 protein [Smithellaceae bacterium]